MGFLNSFTSMFTIGVVIAVIMLVVTVLLIVSRYKTVSSNEIGVKYGLVGGGQSSKQYHGGGTFVWPVIQNWDIMSLDPINTEIDLRNALSKQNIRVNVPSSFTFAIGTTPDLMIAAAERLLGKTQADIEGIARDIIFGQLRATIATMDVEEINGDREKFERLVLENIEAELKKIGLYLINVNISDITDESGYLKALGQEAAARAVNDARVKVANSDRDGAKGAADAEAEQRTAVAEAEARAVEGENVAAVTQANSQAEREVAEAEATRKSDAAKAVQAAEAQAEGYAAEKEAEEARAERDRAAQFADKVVPAEIAAKKVVVDAEAALKAAELKAQATKATERAALEGKAEGFELIVKSAGGDAQAAVMMMIVEQMPAIVAAQAEAISNIEFGKITVIGGGQNGAGGAADFLQSTTSMLPGLHAIAQAAGLELPDYLGKVTGKDADTPVLVESEDVAGETAGESSAVDETDDESSET